MSHPSLSGPDRAPAVPSPPPRPWLHLALAGLLFLLPVLAFVGLARDVMTVGALPYDRSVML